MDKFHDSLDIVAELLCHHHHHQQQQYCTYEQSSKTSSVIARHRVAFTGISVLVVQLLKLLVPVDQASLAISSEFGSALALIYQDKSLSYSFPKLCDMALEFAKAIDRINPELYVEAEKICQSLSSTCSFLLKFDDLVRVKSLHFHCMRSISCY